MFDRKFSRRKGLFFAIGFLLVGAVYLLVKIVEALRSMLNV